MRLTNVDAAPEPIETVPNPVHGSSVDQRKQRGQRGRPTATHRHGCPPAHSPQAAHGHCRARNDMAATQRRYRR